MINYPLTHIQGNQKIFNGKPIQRKLSVLQWLNSIIKPNDKLTFPVLDRIQPFLFLRISNDLDLTALLKYPKFWGVSKTNSFSGIILKFGTHVQ